MSRAEVIGNATLYLGDALEMMQEVVPEMSAKACITDPPYGINTKSDGRGKLSPWGDLCNSAFWYAEWFRIVRSCLSDDGCMWSCLNWRSLVTFQKASCDIRWPIESLMIWDKECISVGSMRGLRPRYEMVALFMQERFLIENRGIADVQNFRWSGGKAGRHPAEKPVDLMEFLVRHSTAKGDLVFDPFLGGGTTGVAAIANGRKFIGIEQDSEWFDFACRRIEDAQRQSSLFGTSA